MNKVQHNNYAMYPAPCKFQITFTTNMIYEIVGIHFSYVVFVLVIIS